LLDQTPGERHSAKHAERHGYEQKAKLTFGQFPLKLQIRQSSQQGAHGQRKGELDEEDALMWLQGQSILVIFSGCAVQALAAGT
jgi:hypothetical protein